MHSTIIGPPPEIDYKMRYEAALNVDAATRRKLASMCETVMRCVLELEAFDDQLERGSIEDQCKKLRAAVLAAT